jgi:hypothetical protein
LKHTIKIVSEGTELHEVLRRDPRAGEMSLVSSRALRRDSCKLAFRLELSYGADDAFGHIGLQVVIPANGLHDSGLIPG